MRVDCDRCDGRINITPRPNSTYAIEMGRDFMLVCEHLKALRQTDPEQAKRLRCPHIEKAAEATHSQSMKLRRR